MKSAEPIDQREGGIREELGIRPCSDETVCFPWIKCQSVKGVAPLPLYS